MLSPVYLSSCANDILKLYNDLNDAIIRDIVRRLVNLDFDISQTAVWQMEKLQEAGGMVYEDALREISKMTGKTEKELKRLFEDAGTESMSFDNSVYRKAGLTPLPLSQSPAMLEILVAGYRKCKGELKNLTLTTANMSQSVFINACNSAYMQVASGAFSQNTAIMNAIETIGNSGSWVSYPSGHRDRVDVAVRRNVQTGIGQTCGQMQIQQLDDMMWDVVDVTAHMGARPEHAQWQGGRFSYKGRNKKYPDFIETTGYGSVDGILGAWCRHNFYPAIDGTPRAYSKEQIDEWNNHKVTYNGVEYSDREALDIQRAKERGLRATKRELVALDEAIKTTKDEALKKELSDDFGRISVKLAKQESSLNDFLDQTGFKKDYSRSQIKEFNRSMSGKVKAASRKELIKQEERDIIKAIKACRIQGDIHLVPRKIDIASLSFDDNHINKEHERNITREQAESFIRKAKISTTVWKGAFERYYSEEGAAYVDLQKKSIRTAYDKERFGQDVIDLMEVLKKYGR